MGNGMNREAIVREMFPGISDAEVIVFLSVYADAPDEEALRARLSDLIKAVEPYPSVRPQAVVELRRRLTAASAQERAVMVDRVIDFTLPTAEDIAAMPIEQIRAELAEEGIGEEQLREAHAELRRRMAEIDRRRGTEG